MGAGADLIIRIATKGATLAKAQLNNLGKEGGALGGKMGKLAKVGLSAVAVGMLGLAKGASASIKAFTGFEDKMTQSLAIMQTTTAQQEAMAQTARDVAMQTTISATESAEAYFFLASAGLDAEQSISALPQVAKFAQAGMFDMALATDLATDAQSALGLTVKDAQKNLENLTRVTDVLVKANTLANATVQQFSEALTNKAGAALKVVGKDIEEGVAVLSAFADRGVKGAEAGEKLNQILRDVSRAVKKNNSEWVKNGIVVTDADGNLLHLGDVVANLTAGMEGLSDTQKAGLLDQLGLNRGVADAVKILAGAEDQIKEYDEALREAGGTTAEVAEKQLESLKAQTEILQNTVGNLAIIIGKDLAPVIEKMIPFFQTLTERIIKFQEGQKAAEDGGKKFKLAMIAVVAVLGPLAPVATAVGIAIAGIVKIVGKGNEEFRKQQEIQHRTVDIYRQMRNQYHQTTEEAGSFVDETVKLEDVLDGTNFTVDELTALLDENGIALDENAKEALKTAEAYEDTLLSGIESVVNALDALESKQERINKQEERRNKALTKRTQAEEKEAQAIADLEKAKERANEVSGLGAKVTAEEELAIIRQKQALQELADQQDGSREKELELQLAKKELIKLQDESVALSAEEIDSLREVERAEERLISAEEKRKEAVERLREEQEKLNKLTEASLQNTLEYAILQNDLNEALEGFGKGTKGYTDALKMMAELTGVEVGKMMSMYDELFAKATSVGLDTGAGSTSSTTTGSGAGAGGGGGGGTKFPTPVASVGGNVPPSQRADLLARLGEPMIVINNNAGTIIGSDEEFVEQTAKAFEKATIRGVVLG
ncbi:MAG: putative minor tail protein [Prokaryotic dsDNA virus sp.]|nr:MAG: putative minor tail protein [Prokaryotic dsDNA virus sp.]|tara:strand:+ start:27758 stop:30256 length:2499 start_codon:yes stop_codon:yes gene_type:complete